MMIYVKCVRAGLLALILVPILFVGLLLVGMIIFTMIHPAPGEGSIGWDPISLYRSNPFVWCIPVLIFLGGFMWEFRRLTNK